MWSLDDVPVYLAIVEQQGISQAARHLGVSKSMASKALMRLETALGVRLMERNSRNMRITSEGAVFYRYALLIMEQADRAQAVMSGLTAEPVGRLVVALPMAFSREIFIPRLPDFYRQYPRIELEIVITSHEPDIIRDQIDLAVVVGPLSDSELVVTRLYRGALIWVASARYVAQNTPDDTLESLRAHLRICETRYAQARFPVRIRDRKHYLDLQRGLMQVNDPMSVRDAVLNDFGVALLPLQYARQQLESGELQAVFPQVEVESSSADLSAVYPARRLLSNKTRALLDFLKQTCALLQEDAGK
ncbi:MAG: LysR family transcriptional regulator [Thiothrix sp.]|nr:LysR family transcriptional regulator [Thiothrix sp.]HPE60299.1 LysR family transcriptional regulator [Thiolinea sp.]